MVENSDNQEFVVLKGEEVVELDEQIYKYLGLDGNNFKYLYLINYQLISVIQRRVDIRNNEIKNKLFYDDYDGLECEVLKPGAKSWQKGKIKVELNVKFYPDESEEEIKENESSQSENQGENSGDNNSEEVETEVSPLDDLRQKFNQENQ
ncbi:KGK domain-containing protein [Dapis sp. BLCC M126]|uniref:KGK domain-containing protein n=1 Tax=Dapis sp. BLCC M126 TaxID=3400189 RepID=UPI003CF02D52